MTEQELKDEREQAVKRGGEIYADHYMEGLLDGKNLALRQFDVSGQLLLKKLETKLNTSGSYSIPYHEDSIMTYGKICDHDDGYLCEHRREWILEFFKSNFR